VLLFLLILIIGLAVLYSRLNEAIARLNQVESRLRALEGSEPARRPPSPVTLPVPSPISPPPVITSEPVPLFRPSSPAVDVVFPPAAPSPPPPVTDDFETQIGSRWMLVVGTVILVLGVAFFVKYAFDNHWVNETARIVIGTVVGLLVWAGAVRLAASGYSLYGQVLAGGGLAMVYITAYAAHALYGLVSPASAFVWMVATSLITVATADRQRSPGLALMASVFAYSAPLLVGREGSHLAFFGFNLVLAVLTLALTLRHGWPLLGFSSLYFASMSTIVWALRAFTPAIYLSTEVYFIASFAIFMKILDVHRNGIPPVALVARGLRFILPLLFHGASLAVLYPHSLALLAYLVITTTFALGIPSIRSSARARLVVWFLIALPFYAWLLQHTSGPWYIAALATSVGLYTLHLLTQMLSMSEIERPANAEIALFHANGLALFLCLYVAVDANAGSTALVAAMLAAWNGLVAAACRQRVPEGTAQALALAFALGATAMALAFAGPWVTVGWAAEGAAIIAVGLAMNRLFLRVGGVGLLAVAVARLLAYQFPVTLVSHRPLFNLRVATATFVIAMFYGVAHLYRRRSPHDGRERRLAINSAITAAHVLTVLLVTAEIVSFWELSEQRLAAPFARQLSISLAWALYALGLIATGFRRASTLLRYLALALFGVTVLKMFSVDLLELAGVYRIVGFTALGLMLLGASFLYQRSITRTAPRAQDAAQ
jgi:uncharacterized membrane protein